ncbi:asparagine synthase (glutamine-hydrolyzing) [Alicyclobacillaceae bacterium I2511]|nr:asparagine synthase (glutamine-hydrolyzing) [Alicyclobacillaceae bacterium I2511]
MCGIAAILEKSDHRSVQKPWLKAMQYRLRHRGPDGAGWHVEPGVGLAMTRLAIVGGTLGQQPIWNERHTLALVCNGEIYNYQGLRTHLEGQGHQFSTDSDVEVLVHLYEQYGEAGLARVRGIYAFVLWDRVARKAWVVRDGVGVKPLYYAETEQELVVASEVRSLLKHPGIGLEWSAQDLQVYHALRFVPGHGTVLKDVRKLPPGYSLTLQGGLVTLTRLDVARMFSWRQQTVGGDRRLLLRQLLFQGVKRQLAPGVQSGVLLSGGLDSTLLLALQTHYQGVAPDTYTVSFVQPWNRPSRLEYDERAEAAQVAARYGSQHVTARFTAEEVWQHLPHIIADLDEPIADPTAIPLWLVARLAGRQGCRVIYSGEGLDELFGGYDVYRQVKWHRWLQRLPAQSRLRLAAILRHLQWPGAGVLSRSVQPVWEWYQGVGGAFLTEEMKRLWADTSPVQLANVFSVQSLFRSLLGETSKQSRLGQMMQLDISAWLPENTLMKSDKLSMAHGVELRVPFLDEDLVSFALSAKDSERLHGRLGKWLVRQAVADMLPGDVLTRRKAGFTVPLSAWLFGEWHERVRDILLHHSALARELYNHQELEFWLNVPYGQRRRAARLLWVLLTLEWWTASVISEKSRGDASWGTRSTKIETVSAARWNLPIDPPGI